MNWKTKLAEKFQPLSDFLFFLATRAQNDSVFRVASSLAYTSLIAIVPLFAIGLAMFSAFPFFEPIRSQFEHLLFQHLTPEFGQEVSVYFSEILQNAAQLTTIGVFGIAVTSIILLSTIEGSFNFIFKVTQPRPIATKITLYWTIITLGPLLLGTAFSMRGYLYTLQRLMAVDEATGQFFYSHLIPPLMTVLSLMLVYILVPNKKVSISSAFVGALVALCLFWFLRQTFTFVVLNNATYKTLYGTLSVMPILLIWMYLSWAVVIFGAVVTAALDEFRSFNDLEIKKAIVAGKCGRR